VANVLSRCDTDTSGEVMAISGVAFKMFDTLRQEFDTNHNMSTLREDVAAGKQGAQWQVVDDLPTVNARCSFPRRHLV
jgi:hypothetical protein